MALPQLPPELLQHIGKYLDNQDLSSFSLSNRQLHWRLFYPLFDRAIAKQSESSQNDDECLVSLFFHAVKHNSTHIAQYLNDRDDRINLNGPIHDSYSGKALDGSIWRYPVIRLPPDFTFLHFALLADAPRVAICLMKNGADISQEVEDYPDLTPLYMALPRSLATGPAKFDSALRIACSYALPRTTAFLLTGGANPNTSNSYGIAAIHTAVMRRQPWRELPLINDPLPRQHGYCKSRWESMLLQTVSTLLDFGADIHLRSQVSRTHECDTSCWRSIDCEHQTQTPLHFASANGIPAIVSRLLDAGADPNMPDAQGYTALYCALVQGHKGVACCILQRSDDIINPIVNANDRTTALHVACRFSFTEMVYELLVHGAYANVTDLQGRTPLHDVLTWDRLEREEELLITLNYLIKFHADPDITTYCLTPRQIAETHSSVRVRDMFSGTREWVQVRRIRPSKFNGSKMYTPNGRDFSGAKRKIESPKPPCGPVPREIDSRLEDSVWAPHKTTHLVKSFEANPKGFDVENTVAIQEPFPNLITKTERNVTNSAASIEGVWSKKGTARIMRGLELRPQSVKPAQHPQQPFEAYPVLRKPTESELENVIQGTLNEEASQFWGNLTKPMASACPEMVIDGNDRRTAQKPEIAKTEANRGKNRRRWAPLRM